MSTAHMNRYIVADDAHGPVLADSCRFYSTAVWRLASDGSGGGLLPRFIAPSGHVNHVDGYNIFIANFRYMNLQYEIATAFLRCPEIDQRGPVISRPDTD